jgi:hypothetical protein
MAKNPSSSEMPAAGYTPQPAMEPTEAASGTFTQAITQIGTKPDRNVIAAWAQAADQSWIMIALIASAVIALLSTILQDFIGNAALKGLTFKSQNGSPVPASLSVPHILLSAVANSLLFVGLVLGLAYGLAFFMPKSFGDVNERFYRALTPVSLAGVCVGIVSLIYSVITSLLYVPFGAALATLSSIPASTGSTAPKLTPAESAAQGPGLGFSCITILLLIGFLTYTITTFVQASAVGSNLSRWNVFFILAGTIVTYFVVSNLVGLPLENL